MGHEHDDAFFARMRDHLDQRFDWYGMDEDNTVECLRLAFEAAENPPRPDEPTGLGAVAVAADGRTWIHHGRGDWMRDDGLILQWNDLTILRVVAEGVQPC